MDPPDLMDVVIGSGGFISKGGMGMGTYLLQPEPRRKPRGEETTRVFYKPSLPEAFEPRPAPPPRRLTELPYLLAPSPWPRGQFRVLPEE